MVAQSSRLVKRRKNFYCSQVGLPDSVSLPARVIRSNQTLQPQ